MTSRGKDAMTKSMKRILNITIKHHDDYTPDNREHDPNDPPNIGIDARAEVKLLALQSDLVQTIHSSGIWGIDPVEDQSYLNELEQEQLTELRGQLHAIGFSQRAITAAFRKVARA